jgi:hypothetical protein
MVLGFLVVLTSPVYLKNRHTKCARSIDSENTRQMIQIISQEQSSRQPMNDRDQFIICQAA